MASSSGAGVVYRETVPLPGWAVVALLAAFAFTVYCFVTLFGEAGGAALQPWLWPLVWIPSLAVAPLVWLFFGRLQIVIEKRVLSVRFGFWQLAHWDFALDRIASAEVVHYRPILQFGGWGIRRGRHDGHTTLVYSLRGTTGVLLTLTEPVSSLWARTDRVLIGSLDGRMLAELLNAASRSA